MQAHIPAKDDPFHSSHGPSTPSIGDQKPPLDVEHANSTSSQQELDVAEDTFANTSVLHTAVEKLDEPRKDPPVNPGPGAKRAELLEYIKQQLDCYGKEPLLMNRYQLLGPDHRATGGAFRFSKSIMPNHPLLLSKLTWHFAWLPKLRGVWSVQLLKEINIHWLVILLFPVDG
jgi:hypothetical protein